MSSQSTFEPGKSKSTPNWLQRVATNLGFSSNESLRETLERTIAESGAEDEDPLSAQERMMLLNVLGFGALRVAEVMVPRADIVAIGEDQPVAALLRLFAKEGHSRVPVYRSSLDDPIGMVHIKDVMAWAVSHGASSAHPSNGAVQDLDLSHLDPAATIADAKLVRDVLFVPPSMPAVNLLAKMLSRQIHLALVVDEFGGIDGLVSFEDLIEEIVGDIAGEHGRDEESLIGLEGDRSFTASARAPIEDVEQVLGMTLTSPGETDEVTTLGGLILAIVGRVPKRGQIIHHPSGVAFEVLEAGPRRLHKVRIFRQLSLAPPSHEGGAKLLLPAPESEPAKQRGLADARAA
jgi:CBS domain containing-hemolysin-like protein